MLIDQNEDYYVVVSYDCRGVFPHVQGPAAGEDIFVLIAEMLHRSVECLFKMRITSSVLPSRCF